MANIWRRIWTKVTRFLDFITATIQREAFYASYLKQEELAMNRIVLDKYLFLSEERKDRLLDVCGVFLGILTCEEKTAVEHGKEHALAYASMIGTNGFCLRAYRKIGKELMQARIAMQPIDTKYWLVILTEDWSSCTLSDLHPRPRIQSTASA